MAPLKTIYAHAIENGLKENIRVAVTHYHIARLYGEAYNKAAAVATVERGFKVTGLFRINRDIV